MTFEEITAIKEKLNELYPDEYYVISDYGWGDGGCQGPYDAVEALKEYSNDLPREHYWPPKDLEDAISAFKTGLNDRGIHCISTEFIDFDSTFMDS